MNQDMIQNMLIKFVKLDVIFCMSFVIHNYVIYPFAKVDENTDILTKLVISVLAMFIVHNALDRITREFPRVREALIWLIN